MVKAIKVGAENIFPDEVEAVLKYHPKVADAVVVGVPDRHSGHRLVALIVPASGDVPSLDELTRFCAARLVGYRVPRELIIVDAITRLDSGRPDYEWATALATERAGAAAS